jgi:CRISP-associated protein Cas1
VPQTIGPRKQILRDPVVFAHSFSAERLLAAWQKVLDNGGAAGGDGVSAAVFGGNLHGRLQALRGDLEDGRYMPGPIRHVLIPKPSGGHRPLAIPCIRDRVAQTALAMTLSPLLEEEFEDSSFGYRPGRSVQQAAARVSYLRSLGLTHVVDADITRFFENVPHDGLTARLGQSMTEGAATQLIGLWLEHWGQNGRGLAQGSPISPLLANLYLDRLDEAFAGEGARIVRFADDFLILCRSRKGAEEALATTERLLAKAGLALNREKTRVTGFEAGFRFLGQVFVNSFVLPDPEGTLGDMALALKDVARRDATEAAAALHEAENSERQKRARLDPGQRVLYLIKAGRRLSLRNHAFAVEEDVMGEKPGGAARGGKKAAEGHTAQEWRDLLLLHPQEIDRIEIGPHSLVEREALMHALGTDTEVAFVNGHGETLGWLSRGHAPRAKRQLAQAAAALDPARKLAFAKAFVEGRVRNERALLRRLNRQRGNERVIKALSFINHLIQRIAHCPDIHVLRGLEGRAAALYWPCLGHVLDHGFTLRKRVREGAADPVNIMLNFTAWLLARDVSVAVQRAGLHGGFGFLHEAADHRDALVYDLMEEFRAPLAEATVASAINQRVLDLDGFAAQPGSSIKRMQTPAQAQLIRTYERFAAREIIDPVSGRKRTWRALISDQAIRLAQAIESGTEHQPVIMDY